MLASKRFEKMDHPGTRKSETPIWPSRCVILNWKKNHFIFVLLSAVSLNLKNFAYLLQTNRLVRHSNYVVKKGCLQLAWSFFPCQDSFSSFRDTLYQGTSWLKHFWPHQLQNWIKTLCFISEINIRKLRNGLPQSPLRPFISSNHDLKMRTVDNLATLYHGK